MNYGRALRVLRSLRNLTQREFAKRADIDASYVCQVEGGKRQPSSGTLEKMAQALELPLYLVILLASDQEDLRGIDSDTAHHLSQQLLNVIVRSEKNASSC